jgi:hypothetical protein
MILEDDDEAEDETEQIEEHDGKEKEVFDPNKS